jgi:uncharacterized membrane protein
VHDLRLGHARELRAALGEAPYEVPERLAGLLGACAQIPGVSRAHVRALEVPHEGADQIIPVMNLAGRQVLEPRPRRVGEVQRQVADDDLVGGGSAQLACQAVVVEPYAGVRLPRVLVDRRGLVEALREARRANHPAEHTGSRGLQRRRAILSAVIAPTPPGVVACRRPCLRVARPPGVDDVESVTVLGLPARVKDPLPDQRVSWVGGPFRRAARVYRCFGALRAPVVLRTPLLADAGCRAFVLLHGRLLDERLCLAVQVSRLGR